MNDLTRSALESAFQSMSDGVTVFDMAGKTVLINEAQARILGYSTVSDLDRDVAYFVKVYELSDLDGRILPVDEWPVSRVLRGESLPGQVLGGRRTDTGQEWVFSFSGEPIRDSAGVQRFAMVITRDVTDVHRAEQAVRDSEERLKMALAHARMGAWDWDMARGQLRWDLRTRALFGLPTGSEALSVDVFTSAIHPEDRERVRSEIRASLDHRTTFDSEYRTVWPDGTLHWLQTTGRALYDVRGVPYRMVGTVLETTRRREDEEVLKAAIRARDEFMSIASHELRTPLTSLKLQAQATQKVMASGGSPEPARLRKFVDHTERQISRLARLVDDMLDIARIETGRLTMQIVPIDLCAVVREAAERVQPQLVADGCELTIRVEGEIASEGDPARLEQVVTNLLTNAGRYGKGKPIELGVRRLSGLARITVTDQGIGVATEDRDRIFGRFERAVPASRVGGLGLGLFIARQIVEQHGGRIWLESEHGQGSTFHVDLPIA